MTMMSLNSSMLVVYTIAVVLCSRCSTAAVAPTKNFLLIAVDDLRPMFGRSYGEEGVLTPNMDKFFLDGNGSVMQNSYVQIAVCGPSRASILTGRRPDTTHVGQIITPIQWCWCQRSRCNPDELFMTFPAHFSQSGYVTAGVGKIYHPDACTTMHKPAPFDDDYSHMNGDDKRAWNYGQYGVEGLLQQPFDEHVQQFSEEQFGTIPGPNFPEFNHTMGLVWMKSPLSDEQQTDGQIATNAIQRLANFSMEGIGKGNGKPFFHAVGFHKPHTPWIVPSKYFDLYDPATISLPPQPTVPIGFKEENWHANGNVEIKSYNDDKQAFNASVFGFNSPVNVQKMRELRHAYFAATSFLDAQVGRVLDALSVYGYKDNTVVAIWSDHGYHLGDTNSWCKMTNFEKATRNTMMWRIPGQTLASQGRNTRLVEMVDFFPTVIDLMGLPPIPKCIGVDQPPTVLCVQGDSYANEFVPTLKQTTEIDGIDSSNNVNVEIKTDSDINSHQKSKSQASKQYAFSQWPYPVQNSPGETVYRMGYTVRSASGFRYTEYVPYELLRFKGVWGPESSDPELYDYNVDPNESVNQALNASYAAIVMQLKAVLREQYDPK